jgi:VPDSG-CTERM motif
MKNKRTILSSVLCAVALALGSTAYATDLNFGDSRDLGLIVSGEPANPPNEEIYINTLIAQPLNSGPTTIDGHDYTRTSASCGTCPAAVFATKDESGGNIVDLGSGFTYLLGKYDGPNGGDEVWYVGGLTGTITIPLNGPAGLNFGLSHWSLFTPGTSTPDGGTTAALLGLALTGLAGLRAKFGRH